MKLPIGYSTFRKIIDNKLDFVDKSLFIKAVLDDNQTQVAVINRPRRFGKTINLSMLHHFLAAETFGIPTKGLFDHLKIAQAGESYMQEQGKHPVIFISFKSIKERSFENAFQMLVALFSEIYREHEYLLSSSTLKETDKKFFNLILEKQITHSAQLASALKDLTRYLFHNHGKSVWVLIDEYDTPIQAAYENNYFDEMVELMRNMFGHTLKDHPYLQRAVITGILHIAKESLFSSLNNLDVCTLLRTKYSEFFGFTEAEVIELLTQENSVDKLSEIRKWYNGYQAGDTIIYNPWSIANYFENRECKPYWVNTSDNETIKNILTQSKSEIKENFIRLLQDNAIEGQVDERTVFADLKNANPNSIWGLLFYAGYLKVVSKRSSIEGYYCSLKIPNLEVCGLYHKIIKTWLSNSRGFEWYNNFIENLLKGNVEIFERESQNSEH